MLPHCYHMLTCLRSASAPHICLRATPDEYARSAASARIESARHFRARYHAVACRFRCFDYFIITPPLSLFRRMPLYAALVSREYVIAAV